MQKIALYLLLICFTSAVSYSQSSISGKIFDAESKETIPSVKVFLLNTAYKTQTDIDGAFQFQNLTEGKYEIQISYPGYDQQITKVTLNPNENYKKDFHLTMTIEEMIAIDVVHTVDKESTSNTIKLQRENTSMINVISAEQMKKTGDSKASDVIKRISGTSVIDNKYVVIRGLSDRYNVALINGVTLPSTESDKKAFSFDLFPSNMLENIIVTKTATAELPSEFAGGVIDIKTISPKLEPIHQIQISSSYNSISTFQNFMNYEGSKLDFLGFGATSRAISSSIPSTTDYSLLTKDRKAAFAKEMNFDWGTKSRMALPSLGLQYTIGKMFQLKNQQSLGFVFAYQYQNEMKQQQITRREFEEQATGVILKSELNDSVFNQSVSNSALLNLVYNWNSKNSITFKNLYTVNSDDKINKRKGVRELDNDPHQWEKSTNIWYSQNNLLTSQVLGDHEISKGKISWKLGVSNVIRDVPNIRRIVYRKYSLLEADTTQQYTAVIQSNGTIPTAAGNMFWSKSRENIYNASYDYTLPLGTDTNKISIKIGGFHQYRDKNFNARNFGFSQYKPNGSSFNHNLLLLPEDEIFSEENLGVLSNGQGGFKLEEASKVTDSYQASSFLNAGFASLNYQFRNTIQVVAGVRLESYQQKFSYVEFGSNLQKNIDTSVLDVLPSINFIYSINRKMNVRASYYKTLSRPEFRELAPFSFYNFIQDNITSGNPLLERTQIQNFDLRYEIFPGDGQLFSVTGFYKNFNNPIEIINRTGTSGAPELYYDNVKKAENFGIEAEFRTNFSFFAKENELLKNLVWYTNFSYIKSKVDLSDVVGSDKTRPLQGQSPFLVNSGIYFSHPTKDWAVACSYNWVSQRIYIVGNVQEPSVWENGRHLIDLQFSKTFKKQFEIKLNIKDMLAQKTIFFQDINQNKSFDKSKSISNKTSNNPNDNVWQEVTNGQTVSISLKYHFQAKTKKKSL